ncbi:hypothetical protein FHETE_10183 [Fusarium heterosporum]|uniref:Uncharacterized protein n=1 Tax=Fusarium heterosporum TaxID=42747 RepID=A0A8H5WGR4_FUSHE|nr:hypothetical protein FHETE_10183 [Fusarium heterosporum]
MEAINKRNAQRLELMKPRPPQLDTIRWNPVDMILTWDGIENEVIAAVAAGKLPNLRDAEVVDDMSFGEEHHLTGEPPGELSEEDRRNMEFEQNPAEVETIEQSYRKEC